ncbi:AAA family ATPase [Bernardetia sp. Wsw4-3y2]|uniref:AAA family ATPase n=1 Tax=Bernardetia sp. Wsw4-3y2 TaxID=3127471 RepID=UPI0030D60D69
MELLYLWIEKYKNIEKQGFNFSPQYHFEYDEDTKELSVDKKGNEDFYKDFFKLKETSDTGSDGSEQLGEITNVTAIIGENGTGKSSILQAIFTMSDNHFYNKAIIRYKISEQLKIASVDKRSMDSISSSNTTHEYFSKTHVLFYSSQVSISSLPQNNYSSVYNLSSEKIIQALLYKNERGNANGRDLWAKILFLTAFSDNKIFLDKRRIPKYLRLKITYNGKNTITWKDRDDFVNKIKDTLSNDYKEAISKIGETEQVQESTNTEDDIENDNIFYRYLNVHSQNKHSIDKLKEYIDKKISEFENFIKGLDNDDFEFNQGYNDALFLKFKNIENEDNAIFDLYAFKIIDVKFAVLPNSLEEFYFSSGESACITLFSRLYDLNKNIKILNDKAITKSDILLLIDEGEAGLHPQWQKKYLNTLLDILPKIFLNKNIQLILTSHSPFLASDLPKENIIFLKKGDDGKCEVADLVNQQRTFGQNIFELFADSFFVQDGLIGKFADNKIKAIATKLSELKLKVEKEEAITSKELNQLIDEIDMIGDDFIRFKFNEYYTSIITALDNSPKSRRQKLLSELKEVEDKAKNIRNKLSKSNDEEDL